MSEDSESGSANEAEMEVELEPYMFDFIVCTPLPRPLIPGIDFLKKEQN